MRPDIDKDIRVLQERLPQMPVHWDGKASILELKAADYNWRQMEWWAFYFEYKARRLLTEVFKIPGDRYGNVAFDLKGAINWDLKAHAVKTNSHCVILNDKKAMELSIEKDGCHGEIIALCDVEYNDANRSFQRWHTELKGGKSTYEKERESRTAASRYRKTQADLAEILLFVIGEKDLDYLGTMRQGRNADGSPRQEKYTLDLEDSGAISFEQIKIGTGDVL